MRGPRYGVAGNVKCRHEAGPRLQVLGVGADQISRAFRMFYGASFLGRI